MNCPTPTIPGTAEYSECACPAVGTSGNTGCDDWFTSCRNPLYALDHPDECGLLTVTEIALDPPQLAVAVERSGMVKVVAKFSDGRAADVTGEAGIGTADSTIARHLGGGVIEGLDVGTTSITATWRGLIATGSVVVFDNACVASQPWDVVIVADDGYVILSSSRTSVFGGRVPALRRFYAGVDYTQLIFNFVLSLDLFDTGRFIPGVGWDSYAVNPIGIGGVRTGNDRIWAGGGWSDSTEAYAVIPPLAPGDVGSQLMAAYQALLTGRPEARKLVVLFSTGGETSCSPGTLGACTALRNNGIEVAVVTPLSPGDAVYSACYSTQFVQVPAHSVLQDAASSPCLFIDGPMGAVGAIPGQLMRLVCEGCSSSGDGIGLIGL